MVRLQSLTLILWIWTTVIVIRKSCAFLLISLPTKHQHHNYVRVLSPLVLSSSLDRDNDEGDSESSPISSPAPLSTPSSLDKNETINDGDPKRRFWRDLIPRNEKVEKQVQERASALKTSATKRLSALEDGFSKVVKKGSSAVIERIAMDIVTQLQGSWELNVLTTGSSKNPEDAPPSLGRGSYILGSSIKELIQGWVDILDAVNAGSDEDQKRWTQTDVREIEVTQTVNTLEYPFRLKNQVFLGKRSVVTHCGQLELDLLQHRVQYAIDELVVLGVTVDVERISQKAAKEQKQQQQQQ